MCLKVSISDGNKELDSKGKDYKVMIFNLPRLKSRITQEMICIESTEICREACYEKNINYPVALDSRENNLKASKTKEFCNLIRTEIDKKINDKKTIYFRIHESGDFYNFEYLNKWIQIANSYYGQNIKFVAYTKSINLLDKYLNDKNKNLNEINIKFIYSIMDDSKLEDINLAKSHNLMTYSALTDTINIEKYAHKCEMGCSSKCDMYCYKENGHVITNLR